MAHTVPETCRRVVQALDAAVRAEDAETITRNVRSALCELIAARAFELPERFRSCSNDHYARRLLHRDERLGYSAVVMTWAPGQATPLHDHAGLWCVDGVIEGRVRVHRYEMLGEREGLWRFATRDVVDAGTGEAGSLIPPFEHHVIENPRSDRTAITLHVYGGDMSRCSVFLPERGEWYRREEKVLCFDD